jgi:hypothetical protein
MYSQIANHASHIISWIAVWKQEKKRLRPENIRLKVPPLGAIACIGGGNPVPVGMAGLES